MKPATTEFRLQVLPCGSDEHRADLDSFRRRSLPVPHPYRSWWKHDRSAEWLWCRAVARDGEVLACFALELTISRLMPWARVGRIERMGRELHANSALLLGKILSELAETTPRLLRLQAQVFDEDPARRSIFEKGIIAAGGARLERRRNYGTTLILDIAPSGEQFLAALGPSARRKVRALLRSATIDIRHIRDASIVDRIKDLQRASFARTGASPPQVDFHDILADAALGTESALLGAFDCCHTGADSLVGFVWGRLHGDHVSYDVAGSARRPELGQLAPGYGLVNSLAGWAREAGARWMDMGGIPKNPDRQPDLAGIRRFKLSFAGKEQVVASEYEFIPRSPFARLGCKLSRLSHGLTS